MKKMKTPLFSLTAVPFGIATLLLTIAAFGGSRETAAFFDSYGVTLVRVCLAAVPCLFAASLVFEERKRWGAIITSVVLWLPGAILTLIV